MLGIFSGSNTLEQGNRMRAVWYERTGPADEVIIVGEQPDPIPGPGEVRIRLMASGVNPADCNRRAGTNYMMESEFVIPNSDGAGIVDAAGSGVAKFKTGERVWLYNGQRNGRNLGTAAELIALDADLVTKLPDNVPFEFGTCLGIPCMTAHRCLFAGDPLKGKTVLVTGGAGAVGNYAIQLAKWAGATVLTTISTPTQAEDAKLAGADLAINRHHEDVRSRVRQATANRGVDRIVDVDFGGNIALLQDVIALNGAISGYATRGNSSPTIQFANLMRKNVTIESVFLPVSPIEARRQAQVDIANWLTSAPRLHRIAGTFPLYRTANAHKAVEAGGKRGTVVVQTDK